MNYNEQKTSRPQFSAQEVDRQLKRAGIQPTAQRIAIYQYVLCTAYHPTVEQIKAWVDANFPKISLATVYNTLKILVNARLLKGIKFPHSDKVIYDNNITEHYHFLDEDTGELYDISTDQFEIHPKLDIKFQIAHTEILLRGTINQS